MIEALLQSAELIWNYYLDGFLAVIAIAITAPMLGVFLVLRRMPLLGLAIPQMAACGQAATFWVFASVVTLDAADPEEPATILQLLGSFGGVLVGLLVLAALARDRRFLGTHAGILFLVAIGLREIFYLETPYHRIFHDAIHHGRLLTVLEYGRDRVLVSCAVLGATTMALYRQLWVSAFDADQARLIGLRPLRWFFVTVLLLGALCGLCVPVVGPEVVLALLLIPPATTRIVAPSLASFAPLSIAAGVLGSTASFVIACMDGVDWPPGPALVICVVASSLLVSAGAALVCALRRRP